MVRGCSVVVARDTLVRGVTDLGWVGVTRDTRHRNMDTWNIIHSYTGHQSPHTPSSLVTAPQTSHNILTLPGKTIQNIKRDNALKNWSNTSILDFLRLP